MLYGFAYMRNWVLEMTLKSHSIEFRMQFTLEQKKMCLYRTVAISEWWVLECTDGEMACQIWGRQHFIRIIIFKCITSASPYCVNFSAWIKILWMTILYVLCQCDATGALWKTHYKIKNTRSLTTATNNQMIIK